MTWHNPSSRHRLSPPLSRGLISKIPGVSGFSTRGRNPYIFRVHEDMPRVSVFATYPSGKLRRLIAMIGPNGLPSMLVRGSDRDGEGVPACARCGSRNGGGLPPFSAPPVLRRLADGERQWWRRERGRGGASSAGEA